MRRARELIADYVRGKRTSTQIRQAALFKLNVALRKFNPKPWNLPIGAGIEITNRCNLLCRMCYRSGRKIEIGDMSLQNFKRIIKKLPCLIWVCPTGFGEPLLHEHLFDMLKYARQKKIDVEIVTNGTLLDERMSEKIVSSGLSQLHVSMDGATPRTYEKIRKGADFYKVKENVSNFVRIKNRRNNSIHIVLRVVAMKENFQEIPSFITLAHELGIEHVRYQYLQYLWNCELSNKTQSLQFSKKREEIDRIFFEARRRAKELGIFFELEPPVKRISRIQCYQPWMFIFVTWQGYVTPCCVVYDVHMGNILESSTHEVWQGNAFVDWRRKMNSQYPPEQCAECADF